MCKWLNQHKYNEVKFARGGMIHRGDNSMHSAYVVCERCSVKQCVAVFQIKDNELIPVGKEDWRLF